MTILQGRTMTARRFLLATATGSPSLRPRQPPKPSKQRRPLSLACAKHVSPTLDPNTAPLIMLHGLFGSKQNNRSMSKSVNRSTAKIVPLSNLTPNSGSSLET